MNWSFLIWFGIGLFVYLTGLGVYVLVRFILNRRKFKKELLEKDNVTVVDTNEVTDNGKKE